MDFLTRRGALVRAYDPRAVVPNVLFDTFQRVNALYDAVNRADALVISTDWEEFRKCNWIGTGGIENLMKQKIIFDGRNMFRPAEMERMGFEYHSVGRA